MSYLHQFTAAQSVIDPQISASNKELYHLYVTLQIDKQKQRPSILEQYKSHVLPPKSSVFHLESYIQNNKPKMKLLVSSLVVCCVVALAMASPTQLPEEASPAEVTDGARDKRSDGTTVTSTTTVQTTGPVPGSVSVVAPPAVVAPVAPVAYPWGAYGYPYGYPWGYPYGAWPYGAPYTVTVGK